MLEDEDSFDSDLDVDQDIRKPQAIPEFVNFISKYQITSDLDRKLLLGVLVRDYHLQREQEQGEVEKDETKH